MAKGIRLSTEHYFRSQNDYIMRHRDLTDTDSELDFARLSSSTRNQTECFALVTGASSEIGQVIAEELARRKINLVLVALPESGLEAVAEHLAKTYRVEVYSYCIDMRIPEAPFLLLHECEHNALNVQILINNAGIGNLELAETSNLDETMLLCP
jgi:short-subunit dehydrogenase